MTNTRPTRRRPAPWRWREGPVDQTVEHFGLHYGDINTTAPADWLLVARVGCPEPGLIHVEFLVDQSDPALTEVLTAVTQEIEFYIVEKREPDPWAYAKYHATTASNLYSPVHWGYQKGAR